METEKKSGWLNEPMNFTRGQLLASWISFILIGYTLAYLLKKKKIEF